MFAQSFPSEYSNTINNIGHSHAQPPPHTPSHPSQAQPSPVQSADDLPAHPIVQQYLLNSNPALPPPNLSSAASPSAPLAPPKPSDFFSHPNQDRPYFLFCLSCSSPLSDVFHVTDGDDTHVTVDAVYTDSVLSATQPTVLPQQGLFYALSCQRCGSHIGRYYRFTSPGAINKCNMFSLDVQCVGVRLLGSATVKGEQYVEETGIATRLTQVMLTTQAVREEMDEVKVEGARMREELERARTRMRRMEARLRQLMGEQYDDDADEVVEVEAKSADKRTAGNNAACTAPATAVPAAASPPPSAAKAAAGNSSPSPAPSSKKRGRPSSKAALATAAVNGGGAKGKQQQDDALAFVPAVKRKVAVTPPR